VLVDLLLCIPALYVGVFIHELGHILAAWTIGSRIDHVRLFSGKPVYAARKLTVGYIPTEGGTTITFAGPLQMIVSTAGGPVANLVTASIALPYQDQLITRLLFAVSIGLTVSALKPSRRALSDGMILWHCARGKTCDQIVTMHGNNQQ
jgi:hypothetical protein